MTVAKEGSFQGEDIPAEWSAMSAELYTPRFARARITEGLEPLRTHHQPTYEHCLRVGILSAKIGRIAGLPQKPLFYAGSLHDRGKLLVPETLLGKTGRWTKRDAEALRPHPVDGYDMTLADGMAVSAGILVLHHTFQPSPYPKDIPDRGPRLPEHFKAMMHSLGRIIALADFYDAATHRTDRSGTRSSSQTRQEVLEHNPDVAELVHELYTQGIFGPI